MRVSMTQRMHFHESNGSGWAEFTLLSKGSLWRCQALAASSEGFFIRNPEFKPVMNNAEMMMLYLKYGGKG